MLKFCFFFFVVAFFPQSQDCVQLLVLNVAFPAAGGGPGSCGQNSPVGPGCVCSELGIAALVGKMELKV